MLKKVDKEKFDNYLLESMKLWSVPGATISIYSQNTELYNHSFGFRNISEALPVTSETVFQIGSITKAFTSLLVAKLVDEGVLEWNKPISAYLHEFEMADLWLTHNLMIEDFLSQRTGMPPYNKFWHGSFLNRTELFERIKYLQPKWAPRTRFEYSNLNYIIVSAILEKITGKPYEALMKEKIFGPLKLESANFKREGIEACKNYALPYKNSNGQFITFEILNIDAGAAAGAINMNSEDLMKWTNFMRNKGALEQQQLISKRNMDKLLEIHAFNAGILPVKFKEFPYTNYGLGWFIEPYKGVNVAYVGGNVEGVVSVSMILPDEDVSIVIIANMHEANFFLLSTCYWIIDHLLENEITPWNSVFMNALTEYIGSLESYEVHEQEMFESGRIERVEPMLSTEAICGTYFNPGFGELLIKLKDGKLYSVFNNNTEILKYFQTGITELNHYNGDVYYGFFDGLGSYIKSFATFEVDSNENLIGLKVKFEPEIEDILFVKSGGA